MGEGAEGIASSYADENELSGEAHHVGGSTQEDCRCPAGEMGQDTREAKEGSLNVNLGPWARSLWRALLFLFRLLTRGLSQQTDLSMLIHQAARHEPNGWNFSELNFESFLPSIHENPYSPAATFVDQITATASRAHKASGLKGCGSFAFKARA
jgi:hypothetical protein